MNWMSNVVPPKIRSLLRRDTPENLWVKCPESGQLVFHKDLEANLMVVPGSGYHMAIAPRARLAALFDEGRVRGSAGAGSAGRPAQVPRHQALLGPAEGAPRQDRRRRRRSAATGRIEGQEVVTAVHDFAFQGGTLGMAAGETIVAAMTLAVEKRAPFVIFTASGGARMQEGMFSLMQMARTTVAVQRLRAARLPYHGRADQSDHRRRHRVLCDAGRRAYRRARRGDRLRRRPRHRADRAPAPARGFPARRIPQGARHGRHGRAAHARCARRWRGCAAC